jgi:hypothetical protein
MLLAHLVTARWLFASETPPQKQRARAAPPSNRNTPAATAARKRTAAAAKEEAADGRGDARRRGQCRGNGVLARAGSCWLVRRAKAAPDTAHVVRSMVTALRLTSEAPPQTQRGTRRATPRQQQQRQRKRTAAAAKRRRQEPRGESRAMPCRKRCWDVHCVIVRWLARQMVRAAQQRSGERSTEDWLMSHAHMRRWH